MKSILGKFTLAAILAAVCISVSCTGQGIEEATYEIVVEGEGNEKVFGVGTDDVQFTVFSERGIGSALIEATDGDFPESVELALHLQGLEELRFGYDSAEVTVSVSRASNSTV